MERVYSLYPWNGVLEEKCGNIMAESHKKSGNKTKDQGGGQHRGYYWNKTIKLLRITSQQMPPILTYPVVGPKKYGTGFSIKEKKWVDQDIVGKK